MTKTVEIFAAHVGKVWPLPHSLISIIRIKLVFPLLINVRKHQPR